MEPKLFKYLVEFCQNHNTLHTLLRLIETWNAILNKSQKFGAIIRELSEALDTLNHKLLLKNWKHMVLIKITFFY